MSSSSQETLNTLQAPQAWERVLLLSDIHLHPEAPHTLRALKTVLLQAPADAILILGDLFEMWVGDDLLLDHSAQASWARTVAQMLHYCASQRPIWIMHGNRDFLLGSAFFKATGCQLLNDPSVLDFHGQRYCLTHGDAWCVDDLSYMQARQQWRDPAWQATVLSLPLEQRLRMGQQLRIQSMQHQHANGTYSDLQPLAMASLLEQSKSNRLIHGHTHAPGHFMLAHEPHMPKPQRWILSDWDFEPPYHRGDILCIERQGVTRLQAYPFLEATP